MTRHLSQLKRFLLWSSILTLVCSTSALCQQPVEVKVKIEGDFLYIDSATRLPEPKLRMNPSPSFLELAFPGGLLETRPFTKAVDKGLIQKVTTTQDDRTALARVYFVTKPKAILKKTETGYQYKVSLRDMARTQERASKPVASRAVTPKPQPKPPTPAAPATPTAAAPVAATPTAAAPVAAAPTAPAATAPKADLTTKPVTVNFRNTPLREAVTTLAKKTGMQVSVDPAIGGVVTKNFAGVPFKTALASILKPYGPSVITNYVGNAVAVRKQQASKPTAPPRPVSTTTATPAAPSAPAVVSSLVREYFPFQNKSAEKAMKAAQLAFPNLSYLVDPTLNVLMVEGTAQEISELEKFLRAQSPK